MPEFTVPPPASPGDRVAVVAPAGGTAERYPHVYERGLQRMREEFDLEPVEYPTATRSGGYLRDHPGERARDLMDAFRDPEIRAVVATIGGNDQVRVLPHLDPAVLRANPTRFFGYSDNTCLASYLWTLGVVSFYGGMVVTEYAMPGGVDDYTREYLERALFEPSLGDLRPAAAFTDEDLDWGDPANLDREPEWEDAPGRTWAGGDGAAEGRVWGGCLGSLEMLLLADRAVPDPDALDGAVLAIETSEELPAAGRVGGVLLALGERGLLSRFDAVLVGRAKARAPGEDRPPDERAAYREAQREAITGVVGEYAPDAPVVLDVEFGHAHPTAPVPVGGRVAVDPAAGRVTFPGG